MGAAEFAEWRVYLAVEPTGGVRDDLHTAMLMTLLANANRDRKRHPKPFTLQEFMPDFWRQLEERRGPDAATLMAKFKMLTS